MKTLTRTKFNTLKNRVEEANNIQDASKKFALLPEVEHTMVDVMGESVDFLKKINVVPVDEQIGQKLGLGVGEPIASRTNTKETERETSDPSNLDDEQYNCAQTNFDTHLDYSLLDAWSQFPDFEARYRKASLKRGALDRIMIGWNGVAVAKATNKQAFPLLQDVNEGWLHKIRVYGSKTRRMMGYDIEGNETADEFRIGEGGDFETLDAAAFDAMNLLDPWFVGSDDLILLLGRELWVNHGLTLYSDSKTPTERNALQTWFAKEAIAGLPTITVPFFPARGLLVTSYDNLSLYFQSGSVRRAIIDNPKRDRVEEYLSSNDAYVVEDYGKVGGIRHGAIKLKNKVGQWV